jgi:hypothetical protein
MLARNDGKAAESRLFLISRRVLGQHLGWQVEAEAIQAVELEVGHRSGLDLDVHL